MSLNVRKAQLLGRPLLVWARSISRFFRLFRLSYHLKIFPQSSSPYHFCKSSDYSVLPMLKCPHIFHFFNSLILLLSEPLPSFLAYKLSCFSKMVSWSAHIAKKIIWFIRVQCPYSTFPDTLKWFCPYFVYVGFLVHLACVLIEA